MNRRTPFLIFAAHRHRGNCRRAACPARTRSDFPAVDEAEQKRLAMVAGAGMVGSHAFDYLAALSDYVGARVSACPKRRKPLPGASPP